MAQVFSIQPPGPQRCAPRPPVRRRVAELPICHLACPVPALQRAVRRAPRPWQQARSVAAAAGFAAAVGASARSSTPAGLVPWPQPGLTAGAPWSARARAAGTERTQRSTADGISLNAFRRQQSIDALDTAAAIEALGERCAQQCTRWKSRPALQLSDERPDLRIGYLRRIHGQLV